jgi:hypothetical protein
MAVLTIKWENASRVSPTESAVVTPKDGEDPAAPDAPAAPAVKRAAKPMLVYIADPAVTEGFNKVEQVVLTDDKVVVGTWAFTCIKMTPEQAAQDPLLAKAGKELPRVVFVTSDYAKVEAVEGGKLSVGGLWSEMQAQFKKHYKGDLEKNVKSLIKVLGEFDKIANERTILEEKKTRADKPTDADQADWKKTADEINEREKKANEQRDTLLKFEPKQAAA